MCHDARLARIVVSVARVVEFVFVDVKRRVAVDVGAEHIKVAVVFAKPTLASCMAKATHQKKVGRRALHKLLAQPSSIQRSIAAQNAVELMQRRVSRKFELFRHACRIQRVPGHGVCPSTAEHEDGRKAVDGHIVRRVFVRAHAGR